MHPTTIFLEKIVPRIPMEPGYISLAYLIYILVVPVTWQSMEVVAFHFNIQ